ncbi:MAG: hypothetical protein D3916_16770 [Candidatus Electrothrix sp. MAN1_4]|nr:hypothetical protein [Candidatus Electrothrix sp. MAN1_4]
MTDANKSKTGNEDELRLLRAVGRCNLILLILLTTGSWYLIDSLFAQSVLIGSALASGSFFWLKRTAVRFIQHAASLSDEQKNSKALSAGLSGFTVKFYARLGILALVLLLLNTQFSINAVGLSIGLSTIMVSIIIVVLFQGRMLFQENM